MNKNAIKKHLLKNHLYRIAAGILGIFGLIIFVVLYKNNLDGQPGILLEKPGLIILMFFPFIPSAVFLFLSKRERRRATGLSQSLKA